MKDKKKRKSLEDDLELAASWVGHVDPTKSKLKSSDPEWNTAGEKVKKKRKKGASKGGGTLGVGKIHKYTYNPLDRFNTITGKKFKRTWQTLAEPDGHHECQFCGEVYTKTASLEKHIGRSHNPNLSVQCPECPKMMSNKNAMKKHLLSHRPKHTWPWYCEYCDEKFQAKGDIPRHWMTTTHKDDPKVPKAGSTEKEHPADSVEASCADPLHLGDIVTTDKCTASAYGDSTFMFRWVAMVMQDHSANCLLLQASKN